MANLTLRGVITMIDEARVYGNFEKRIFWLQEQNVQYPNTWLLECQQNDSNLLDQFRVGQEVECSINIRGRYWEKPEEQRSGVINTLRCWKITPVGQQQGYGAPQPQGQYQQPKQAPQQRPQYQQPGHQQFQQPKQQQRTYQQPQQRPQYNPPAQQPQQYSTTQQKQYAPPQQPQQQYQPPQQQATQSNNDEDDLPF